MDKNWKIGYRTLTYKTFCSPPSNWYGVKVGPGTQDPGPRDPGTQDPGHPSKIKSGTPGPSSKFKSGIPGTTSKF